VFALSRPGENVTPAFGGEISDACGGFGGGSDLTIISTTPRNEIPAPRIARRLTFSLYIQTQKGKIKIGERQLIVVTIPIEWLSRSANMNSPIAKNGPTIVPKARMIIASRCIIPR
jgi:hypothetical protein